MIKNLNLGETITDFFIIKDIQLKTTAQGKPYLSAKLLDRSSSVELKVWDYSGELVPSDNGKIVKVQGTVTNYRESLQINGELIRLATDTDVYDKSKLIPTAPIDVQDYTSKIKQTISAIKDPTYNKICNTVWDYFNKDYIEKPAAKGVHHAFLNGLLMHSYNMMKTASTIGLIYSDTVDGDLLVSGAFLHDIGKLFEYNFDSSTNLAVGFSFEGELLGHLIIGSTIIRDIALENNLDMTKVTLLQNMLLSHHGKPEYGSAVSSKTLEAELLHYIDLIDSRVEICRELFEKTPFNSFTEKHFALDDRAIYKHYVNSVDTALNNLI